MERAAMSKTVCTKTKRGDEDRLDLNSVLEEKEMP